MLKDPKNLLWIIPLVAVLTIPLWKPLATDFLSPVRRKIVPAIQSSASSRFRSSSEMSGVQFEQSENGTKEWLLTASRLSSRENDTDMRLEDVRARFFGTGGKNEETRVSSQRARYNAATNRITLLGGVVILNDNGYRMQTESMEYLGARKKIRTTSPVSLQGSHIAVKGNRLLYDLTTGNYRVDGDVVCRLW
jgi:LPS export ABC transporter protein LptC